MLSDGARFVPAGEGEKSRGPGEDAFLAGRVEESGHLGEGRGVVGPVGEVAGPEQDEVAFAARDVIQGAGLRSWRTGRPMKNARSSGQSSNVYTGHLRGTHCPIARPQGPWLKR